MITYTELRKISLEFRRLSSNLLRSSRDDSDVSLARFMKYIEATPFIYDAIHNTIDNVDFDFKQCFLIEGTGGHGINIPEDEACHLKAQYDYMIFILSEDKRSVSNEAFKYPHSSNHWSDIIQGFLDDAVKPMIDYINDAISTEMIIIEEEEKKTAPSIVQNIGNNYGTLNAQGTGSIVSTNNTSIVINDINELLSKIILSIDGITDVSNKDRESVKDDLESIQEQINSPEPKKSRMQKALAGIKKFAGDFSMKLAVTLAAGAVTGADWNLLIQKLEQFIS
mgnify:CR=1 FL=1